MTQRITILTLGLLAAVACGCKAPDSGLTQTQVTQMLEIEQATQRERAELFIARDQLEADRRTWAERERSDPIIAEAINNGFMIVVCCLPLLLMVLLVLPTRNDVPAELICEALIGDSGQGPNPKRVESVHPSHRLD